jgi:hypothetical protein
LSFPSPPSTVFSVSGRRSNRLILFPFLPSLLFVFASLIILIRWSSLDVSSSLCLNASIAAAAVDVDTSVGLELVRSSKLETASFPSKAVFFS